MTPRGRRIAIMLALVLVTTAVYGQVIDFQSVSYDDPDFIGTAQARQGLSPASVRWAMTAVVASNWHPVTMLSHLLDAQLFGQRVGLHHLTSVLIHIANSLLLFAFLHQLTEATWRSALVAALFALHPLHVESVAWIAERKDVLSTFFFLLTLMAYVQYARGGGGKWYAACLVLFALGLMSKPMLVTVPGVMLILDCLMLKRQMRWALVWEKVPFVLVAIVDATVTFLLQQQTGAVASIERVGLDMRIANAIVSYVRYLWMTIWPGKLAVLYPYPDRWSAIVVIGALVLLIAITILAIRQAKSRPYLLFGWLWYLGTLVPVIGIVQVGHQALADRYTYIPLIGPFIALAWSLGELSGPRRSIGAIAVGIWVVLLAGVTAFQVRVWRDSITLFTHAVNVTRDNWVGYNHLATALREKGDLANAIAAANHVVRIRPTWPIGQFNLGNTLLQANEAAGAIAAFERAIVLQPNFAKAHNNLGRALIMSDRIDEAITHFRAAVEIEPNVADWQKNLAAAERLRLQRATTAPSPSSN